MALVDFHDAMELILDSANAKDTEQVVALYPEISAKLQVVEGQDTVRGSQLWTKGICPNCGDAEAEVDPDGILWCCACGYSKKGCYT